MSTFSYSLLLHWRMQRRALRLLAAGLSYLAFGVLSSWYYHHFIHDVGGALWSVGIWALPLALLVVWPLDVALSRGLRRRPWHLAVIASLTAVLFYLPGVMLVLALAAVFS